MTVETYAPARHTDDWAGVVDAIASLARNIAGTSFVPDSFRGDAAQVAAAILYGREVGLPPMTALRTIFIVKGRPAMYAEAMRGLIVAAGHELIYRDANAAQCVAAGRRRDSQTWSVVTYTMDDARQAGLAQMDQYKRYPRAMLKARATTELARDVFPDVIGGFASVEELQEPESAAETTPRRTRVRRAESSPTSVEAGPRATDVGPSRSEKRLRALADVELPETDDMGQAIEAVEATLGPVQDVTPQGGPLPMLEPHEPATGSEDPYTDAQRKHVLALFNDLGIGDRQDRLDVSSAIIRRDIKSANELSSREAALIIDALRIALESDEPQEMLDSIKRAHGLVVDVPMFDDGGNPA